MPQLTPYERAIPYIEQMPESIQGEGGSLAIFKVATTLTRGFGLDREEALGLLTKWNEQHAHPQWSPAELRHKIEDAMKSKLPLGYLLDDDVSAARPFTPRREAPPPRPQVDKEEQRSRWPEFQLLDSTDVEEIASLRCVPVSAVLELVELGIIGKARVDGHRCFVMHERSFAQARRFDGGMLRTAKGESKAKNLLGSEGAFFGVGAVKARQFSPVVLIEGVIGHLETLGLIQAEERSWLPLAATSAGSKFSRDPDLLRSLAHRRVRIIPDNGEAGLDAAATWLAELENVGAFVDVLYVPDGCSDLGDILKAPNQHAEFLKVFSSHELIPID